MDGVDGLAKALGIDDKKKADWHTLAKVSAVNADGSLTCYLSGSASPSNVEDYCQAQAGDVVCVLISNGKARAIATRGGGPALGDYVVEQGTSGQWFYRKWNSGVAECWGDFSHSNVAITSKSGNAWYSGELHEDFPSGLFNATPKYCDVSLNPTGGASVEAGAGLSSSRTQSVWLMRVESSAAGRLWLQVLAIGTWK